MGRQFQVCLRTVEPSFATASLPLRSTDASVYTTGLLLPMQFIPEVFTQKVQHLAWVLSFMPYPASQSCIKDFGALLWRTPEVGSRTLLFSALSNEPPSMAKGGQYIDALCHPALDDDHPKMKALRDADDKWAERLWNVSLRLLMESPAQNVVQMAP